MPWHCVSACFTVILNETWHTQWEGCTKTQWLLGEKHQHGANQQIHRWLKVLQR